MNPAADPALLGKLRAQAEAPARSRAEHCFPVPEVLAGLLPDPGLRVGAAYSLDVAGSLLASLLAEPSKEGLWCGVVGIPEFGAEAAERAGVCLERLVLVPEPAEQWLAVTAALAEALPVLVVRPAGRVSAADATRLAARLRDRRGVLLVHGDWPRAEARLSLGRPRWHGLGSGHGHLSSRELTLTVTSRRFPVPRQAEVLLPTATGRMAAARPAEVIAAPAAALRVAG